MTSASSHFEVGAVVLGFVGLVASWRRPTAPGSRFPAWVIVQSSAATDDGAYEPAQSVCITTREGLLALRSAIDEALKEPQQ